MSKTKYILDRIEELEKVMKRRMELNQPYHKMKPDWFRQFIIELHREQEFEIMNLKMKLPLEDYSLLEWSRNNYVEFKQKNVEQLYAKNERIES